MPIYPYLGRMPNIHPSVFVAPTASIVGDVTIEEGSSIWYGVVLRGDVMPIRIGKRTSIQDNSVIHSTGGYSQTVVGDDVTVGHSVILHGCIIGSRTLVGMGSIVLDNAELGDDAMLGAGSLVTSRTKLPSKYLSMGRPAKALREMSDNDRVQVVGSAELYVQYGKEHKESLGL